MKHRSIVLCAAIGLLVAGCGDDGEDSADGSAAAHETTASGEPSFAYSGPEGPENWGSLDPSWVECAEGRAQSPIELTEPKALEADPIELDYGPIDPTVHNNGHTIEFEVEGDSSVTIDGKSYTLLQFHFHAPSEHSVEETTYPLEFHFVNLAEDASLAVIGVFAEEGSENEAFAELLAELPRVEGEEFALDADIDAATLLPDDAATGPRWTYEGSLTTPPCSEIVSWNVLDEPIELSAEQIDELTSIYEGNSRPQQPLNGRELALRG